MIVLADAFELVPPALKTWDGFGWVLSVCIGLAWLIDVGRKAKEFNKLNEETKKLNAEVTKLKAEEIKLASDVLEKLQRARDNYRDACVAATKAVIALTKAIKDGEDDVVIPQRNAFCDIVASRVLHHYGSLVEWECLNRKQTPERLVSYVQNDVLTEVARITDWVGVINLPMFHERYGASPLVISEQTLRPIMDVCYSLPDDYAKAVKESLHSTTMRLQTT